MLLSSFCITGFYSIAVGTDSDLPNYYLTYQLICTYSKASVDTDLLGSLLRGK